MTTLQDISSQFSHKYIGNYLYYCYVAMQLHHTLADGIALVQLLIGVITMIVAHVFLEANALFFLGLMLLLCGFATGARDRQGFH